MMTKRNFRRRFKTSTPKLSSNYLNFDVDIVKLHSYGPIHISQICYLSKREFRRFQTWKWRITSYEPVHFPLYNYHIHQWPTHKVKSWKILSKYCQFGIESQGADRLKFRYKIVGSSHVHVKDFMVALPS